MLQNKGPEWSAGGQGPYVPEKVRKCDCKLRSHRCSPEQRPSHFLGVSAPGEAAPGGPPFARRGAGTRERPDGLRGM